MITSRDNSTRDQRWQRPVPYVGSVRAHYLVPQMERRHLKMTFLICNSICRVWKLVLTIRFVDHACYRRVRRVEMFKRRMGFSVIKVHKYSYYILLWSLNRTNNHRMNTRLICIYSMFQRSTIAISSPQSMKSGKRPVSTPNQPTPKRKVVDDNLSFST